MLINELSLIKQRDENLRKLVKLPEIDEDTRKLGTGGIENYKDINDLNYLLPNVINLNKIEDNLDDILPKMDAAIIVTSHDDFKKIKISSFAKMKNPILIDTRGIIDPSSAKLEKIIFRGLGRGNS